MVEKSFIWTPKLATKFFKLRLEHEWLFKKKAQAWKDFRNILLQNGFPEKMTLDHMRKKWTYTYDCYRHAKKTKCKNWLYYKLFDKYLGKHTMLDKYSSWNDEWRLRLIKAYTSNCSNKNEKHDFHTIWRVVEKELLSKNLPLDCCIQDLRGLWHHLHMTFKRKHKIIQKKGIGGNDWPLYNCLLEYYKNYESNTLIKLNKVGCVFPQARQYVNNEKGSGRGSCVEKSEFQWSKDITETFIQIRLQHEWLFRERKWAWNDLRSIMCTEYGFPNTLTTRTICSKWSSTYAEYQKAKATNNDSWIYFNLFEVYLGESRIDPLRNWQEDWIKKFIYVRTELEKMFQDESKPYLAWREVEKRLRSSNLPRDHTLLDLPEMWVHLTKTYKWKQKFAAKGILSEVWPYYEAMEEYHKTTSRPQTKFKQEYCSEVILECADDMNDDDREDDIKLFDLKQKMQEKYDVQDTICRTCNHREGCVSLFEPYGDDGVDLNRKLKIVCCIEVKYTDNLPTQICFDCLRELDSAYKFRRKCEAVDKHFRSRSNTIIKIELEDLYHNDQTNVVTKSEQPIEHTLNLYPDFDSADYDRADEEIGVIKTRNPPKIRQKCSKKTKKKYEYVRMCEVCGKKTRNMKSHMDMHAKGKFYKCDQCDKRFKFKSGLVIHKSSHNPTPRKTCEVCGKTFHILASYRKHFVYHANERKHACDTCGKCFNTKDILTVHMRMHTDERPFSCSDCGKTFRTAGCVSRHKRIVHKNVSKA